MGGFFGCASKGSCVADIFYGSDYHSHLGNIRGGLLVYGRNGFQRFIHDIRKDPFRSKFEQHLDGMDGNLGIGSVSDTDPQPLNVAGEFGTFGVAMVGLISNQEALQKELCHGGIHFSELVNGKVGPTEIAAALLATKPTIRDGLLHMQEKVEGSCSVLVLSPEGVYACRDKLGRTPVVIGRKDDGSFAASLESCALHNLGYKIVRWLGPGEAVLLDGKTLEIRPVLPARKKCRMCAFMWIYFGFPASSYDGVNVEEVRYRCGAALASHDKDLDVDAVAGVPDSGTAHALGYAGATGIPYRRSFIKYTPTWPRSFISDSQTTRRHVAKMKLIPIQDFIRGRRLLFCEDSIVRGTQLKDTFARLPEWGAKEVHVRAACPPILFGCKYLNFSTSRGPLELIARRAIHELEGGKETDDTVREYADDSSEKYQAMVDLVCKEMGFTSLKYQPLKDTLASIGVPQEGLCTYCWDGAE